MPHTGGMAITSRLKFASLFLVQTSVRNHWEKKAAKRSCKTNNTARYLSHLWLIKKTLKGVKEILMYMSGEEFVGYANKSFNRKGNWICKKRLFWWHKCHFIIGIVQILIEGEWRCKIQHKLSNRPTHFQYMVNEQVIAFNILTNVQSHRHTLEIKRLGISSSSFISLCKTNFVLQVTLVSRK